MKYIYHHMGLGDHIICNGLVRTLMNPDEEYSIFVKSHNMDSVKFMYRDLKNLQFIEGDDAFVESYINKHMAHQQTKYIGFLRHGDSKEFDDSFYLQHNVPFINRWTKFYVERDIEKELELFSKYDIKKDEYVFIHDDWSRDIKIDETFIVNKDKKIVRPKKNLTKNIFDYLYLMENSCELHFVDSSFRLMYDSVLQQKENLFYHLKYPSVLRDASTRSQSKLNYKIV